MASHGRQDHFEYALGSNAAWAGYKNHQNPDFFPKLASGQTPIILWIGCADSRVPETTILGAQPGDVFVHRNIANIVSPTDLSYNSVLEYAVVHLKVQHIVLCGHTTCGGCAAALGDKRVGGVLDAWLTPLRALRRTHEEELSTLSDSKRMVRLAELNVIAGVETLMGNYVVEDAINERGLKVHGTMYDLASGRLRELPGIGHASSLTDSNASEEKKIVKGNHAMLMFGGNGAQMAIR